MNKKKRSIRLIICMIAFAMTMNFGSLAANYDNYTETPSQSYSDEASPKDERTVWIHRTNEYGVKQKRLWSITYGVWLTGWIDED